MNGSLGHSSAVLRFSFFSHDNSPSRNSKEDLFAVRLPAGIVRLVEKHDNTKQVLENLLLRGFGTGHDDLRSDRMFALLVVRSFESSA
jgi:hypothetical protein